MQVKTERRNIALSGAAGDGLSMDITPGMEALCVSIPGGGGITYRARYFKFARGIETFWMPETWSDEEATAYLSERFGFGTDTRRFLEAARRI